MIQRTPVGQKLYEALQEHALWRVVARKAVQDGRCNETAKALASDNECPLGKWLHYEIDHTHRSEAEYEILKEAHRRFHLALAGVVAAIERGDLGAAAERVEPRSEFADLCSVMNRELLHWLAKTEAAHHRAAA